MTVIPLQGPLADEPTGLSAQAARAHLGAALQRIPRGTWDDQIAAWLSGKDTGTIATIASWLRRSYEAGVADGRAVRLDEDPVISALTARVEELERVVQSLREDR